MEPHTGFEPISLVYKTSASPKMLKGHGRGGRTCTDIGSAYEAELALLPVTPLQKMAGELGFEPRVPRFGDECFPD